MCCQQLTVPSGGYGVSAQLTPKRYSSISSNDEFASIAADTLKINGAFKQFKQVRSFLELYFFKIWMIFEDSLQKSAWLHLEHG